jgi:hypothetical protein
VLTALEGRHRSFLNLATIAFMLAVSLVILWLALSPATPRPESTAMARVGVPPNGPVSLATAEVVGGEETAPTLLVIGSIDCPASAQFFRQVLPGLRARYVDTRQLRLALLHVAMPRVPTSMERAVTLECARRHGRFWPALEMFQSPADPATGDRNRPISDQELGDLRCNDEDLVAALTQQAVALEADGVLITPTLMFGLAARDNTIAVSDVLIGMPSPGQFRQVLNRLLSSPRGE